MPVKFSTETTRKRVLLEHRPTVNARPLGPAYCHALTFVCPWATWAPDRRG
jgi:hypothetical protein